MPEGWTEIASFDVRGVRGGRREEKLFVQDKFADKQKSNVMFSLAGKPVFYSNAAHAVEGIKQEKATPEQLVHVEVDEEGLHWPEIDEDLSFAGLLRGDWGQHVRAPGEAMCVCEGGAPGNGKGETSDLARKGGEGV